MKWDLWVDYHRTDGDRLTHTNVRNAEPGVVLQPGAYVIVGNEEADPAVAEVVTVKPSGVVLVRVLPGPAEDHLHLVERTPLSGEGREPKGRAPVGDGAELEESGAQANDAEAQHLGKCLKETSEIIRLVMALRQRREALGVTIEQVAERSGLSADDIQAIEDNAVHVPLEHLARYAEAVDMRLDVHLATA